MLADLVRGAGGKSYAAGVAGKKGKGKAATSEKVGLDLQGVCGGKVELSKEVSGPQTS
jgi:ATP-dependent DNA helicase Q1